MMAWVLSGCAATSPERPGAYGATLTAGATVAVWNLENLSIVSDQGQDLEDFLTAKIVETLKNESDYEVVEREQLLLALEELNIGSSALAGEQTGLRIGRILGAQLMVFGAYQFIGDTMRIDLRLVEVETGRILLTSKRTVSGGTITAWLKAAEKATVDLI
jgi:curli biogenesis system outer membrane secretion channel CsgG